MSRVLSLIVNYNGGHWVEAAVASLLAQSFPTDVLVVDNGSTDGSAFALRERFGSLVEIFVDSTNPGPAASYNRVLERLGYDYYFFLNPDANAPPDAVERLVDLLDRRPDLAVLGPAIVEHDLPDRVQEFAPILDPILFTVDRYVQTATADLPDRDYVHATYGCAAAVMCRASAYAEVGGNDGDFFMFVDEPDLCWRMRLRGWKIAVTPRVRVRHVGGLTAPVGFKNATYVTSVKRIYLRERNCLVMAIKCYAMPTLVAYCIFNALALALEASAMILVGKREIARGYFEALRDVWKTRATLATKRASVQKTRRVSEFEILRERTWEYGKLRALRARGLPSVVSFAAKAPAD